MQHSSNWHAVCPPERQDATWWDHEVLVLLVASVALCLLALPESRPGLVANAVILILWLIVSRIEG